MVGSVVIVTYNCAGYIRECLGSLREWAETWEVAVADNGSTDDTLRVIADEFPWVKTIALGANIGFSFANNRAAELTTAPWILFLNPDTVVAGGALDRLMAAAMARKAVVIAPRLNGTDGEYQIGSADDRMPTFTSVALKAILPPALRPRSILTRAVTPGGFDPNRAQTIERPAGAAILIRRDVYESIGGWDERFAPVWMEDIDLCKRLLESGFDIWYEPGAIVVHIGQHTLPMFRVTRVLAMWHANLIRYARKHFPRWQAFLLRPIFAAGIVFRAVVRAADPSYRGVTRDHLRLAWQMVRYSDERRWFETVTNAGRA